MITGLWKANSSKSIANALPKDLKGEAFTYTVKRGDTLWEIAKALREKSPDRFGSFSIDDIVLSIASANNIKIPSRIITGQKITICALLIVKCRDTARPVEPAKKKPILPSHVLSSIKENKEAIILKPKAPIEPDIIKNDYKLDHWDRKYYDSLYYSVKLYKENTNNNEPLDKAFIAAHYDQNHWDKKYYEQLKVRIIKPEKTRDITDNASNGKKTFEKKPENRIKPKTDPPVKKEEKRSQAAIIPSPLMPHITTTSLQPNTSQIAQDNGQSVGVPVQGNKTVVFKSPKKITTKDVDNTINSVGNALKTIFK